MAEKGIVGSDRCGVVYVQRSFQRHAIRDRDLSGPGREGGFEDKAALDVTTAHGHALLGGGQRPASSPVVEERGEYRWRVEARKTQPIDGAVTGNERRRVRVSHERVVLYRFADVRLLLVTRAAGLI